MPKSLRGDWQLFNQIQELYNKIKEISNVD